MTPDRVDERLVDELIDELARCYVRAAFNQLLADQNKSAAESGQDQRRREGTIDAEHTPIPAST